MKITSLTKYLRAAALCVVLTVVLTACGKDFDASGYTQAILDLTFQGETEKALEIVDGVTEESLLKQYQQSIDTFVANNITNEIDMTERKTAEFTELIKKVFSTMRYKVGEADKTGKKEFEVPVEIQPSDVFTRFQQALTEDSLKIAGKVREGGYEGTDEEVTQQILNDIVNHAYELLDVSYENSKYGDSQTVILKVKADKDNEYSIDEDDMNNLIVKILRLDEIQG